ncbi:MAG TPA: zinc ribbon domain-containing protein [Anaerolineae bacterium]|nr:zinc ribbon domain-containing protein [Caldilineae bacterium]HID35022.1 zinc ribbon domain-containing protein [Anaerolineae bacterium]
MPIYEYQCHDCGHVFSKLWRSLSAAQEAAPPPCPQCGGEHTARIVSNVAVLDGMGGLTPSEQAAVNRQAERDARILPKSKIEAFRKAKREGGK